MYPKNNRNRLTKVTVNLSAPGRKRLDEIAGRTKFSRGEIISHVMLNQPLPRYVLASDTQYHELSDRLTEINQSLGALSEDSDSTVQLILEGLQDGHVPDDKKYRRIIEQLRDVRPQVQRVNRYFRELQRANLFFLYGHRKN